MVVSGELILSQKSLSEHRSRKQYTIYKLHHFLHKNATQEKKTNKKMVSMMSTTSAFISSPTTLKLRKKSNTNKRSNNSLLIAKAISVADVTGPVKETIKDVQSVEVQNTMRFSFSRENSKNNCANS